MFYYIVRLSEKSLLFLHLKKCGLKQALLYPLWHHKGQNIDPPPADTVRRVPTSKFMSHKESEDFFHAFVFA